MTGKRFACATLLAFATTSCGGGGVSHLVPQQPAVLQPDSAVAVAETALREVSTRRPATPQPLATGLVDPTAIALHHGKVYIGDVGSLDSVLPAGGGFRKVLTGTSIFDSGSNRGINQMAFAGKNVLVGFGGYVQYDVVTAPIASGVQTVLATLSGGSFIGVIGANAYYSRGFCCIDSLPLAGGASQTVLTGIWVRSVATDATSIFFVNYWTRDVMKFDVTTATAMTLISGNPTEGKIALDATHVYHSQGAAIQKVAKLGGAVTTLYTGTAPQVLAADDDDVFFLDGSDLRAVPSAGGTARTLVSGVNVAAATANKRYLYYVDDSHGVGSSVAARIRTGP